MDLLPVLEDPPGDVRPVGPPEHAHRQLGAAGTHEAGEPDDLTLADHEARSVDDLAALVDRVVDRPVLDPQDLATDLRGTLGEPVVERATDHAADDALLRDRLGAVHVERLDRQTVADHRRGVCDRRDLVELVRDDDRGDALALEAAHQVKQVGAVLVVERRGGLVEDQQLDALGQRLRDLDQLLLADADVHDLGVRGLGETDTGEQLGCLRVGLGPVDHATRRLLVPEEDVLGDREERAERELLVDDDDAAVLAVADALELADLGLEDDVALVGAVRVDAREHLHEGGLAGAVLAADRVDLSPRDVECHILQCLDARERLRDPAHLKNDVVGRHFCLLSARSGGSASRPGPDLRVFTLQTRPRRRHAGGLVRDRGRWPCRSPSPREPSSRWPWSRPPGAAGMPGRP
ncbi:hypothetical protein GALL_286070 [mine drainage metagenome]|uniref:Uncharacterized protein n=1 Tax=mine drainage metagenome TaxID=410659 RepID=A0A1J5R0P7_9ZZZZ